MKTTILILILNSCNVCFSQYGALFEPIFERLNKEEYSFIIELDNDTIMEYSNISLTVTDINNFIYHEGDEGDTISTYLDSKYGLNGKLKKYCSKSYTAVYHYKILGKLSSVEIEFTNQYIDLYNLNYEKVIGKYTLEKGRIIKIEMINPYLEYKMDEFIISYY